MTASVLGIAVILAQATATSSSPLETKIVNSASSPVHIDSCRGQIKVYGATVMYEAFPTLHNVSKKNIKVIGFTLVPLTAFNDSAGSAKTSLLMVNLAPGDEMNEDYPFTDGAKEPLLGDIGSPGASQGWSSVYIMACVATQVRFADGSVWKI